MVLKLISTHFIPCSDANPNRAINKTANVYKVICFIYFLKIGFIPNGSNQFGVINSGSNFIANFEMTNRLLMESNMQ
jgi:hypothetical protein